MNILNLQKCTLKILLLALPLSIILLLSSCKSTEPDRATTLINKAIEAHGGMELWNSMDTMIYRKKITLYDKEGNFRKYVEQNHNYSLSSELEGRYSYHDSVKHEVVFDGKKAYKIEGGMQKEPDESAIKNFYSAYYVLNMPWKLLDEGANATYVGTDTLFSGQVVESIKVEYTSGLTKDTWWYYFDPITYEVAACLVHHPPTYNLITNDYYASYQGLIWNHKRSSYRADENGEVLHLLGKYVYEYGTSE